MAIDPKYGRVTLEHGSIGEDEPVIVFRARDTQLPKVLAYYHLFCIKAGSPRRHLDMILDSLKVVQNWQAQYPGKLRVPTSEHSRDWLEKNPYLPPAPDDNMHVFSDGTDELVNKNRCLACGVSAASVAANNPCLGEYRESMNMRNWADNQWKKDKDDLKASQKATDVNSAG